MRMRCHCYLSLANIPHGWTSGWLRRRYIESLSGRSRYKKHGFDHRPYSRQVTEQLPLSGSLHSRQLVYLKAGNAASSENHDFLEVHFNVHCGCISQSSFGQLLLCTFNYYIMMCSWRIKNMKLYIWPIFTCVNRTFDTGYPVHVSLLPLWFVRSRNSVYFFVRFPLSDERTWVARQENSIGADGESLPTTQPSYISWDYKFTHDTLFMHLVLFNHPVYIL